MFEAELTYDEVARIMGIPVDWVMRAEKSAFKKLREHLDYTPFEHTPEPQVCQEKMLRPHVVETQDLPVPHYVYFIVTADGLHCKIGHSKEPRARLENLQVAHPEPLEIRHTVLHSSQRLACMHERWLHEQFSPWRECGEWFEYTGDLKEWVEKRVSQPVTEP